MWLILSIERRTVLEIGMSSEKGEIVSQKKKKNQYFYGHNTYVSTSFINSELHYEF